MKTNTPCPHPSIVVLEQGDKLTTQCTRCGKKMKVVKKPSCSCYGGFDCEVCNPDYYEEMTTTDTPRTNAYQYADYILNHYDRNSHMDKLCLAKSLVKNGYGSKAEVERLKKWKDNLISNLMALEIYEHKYEDDPSVALAAYGQWNWNAGEWEAQGISED